MCFSRLLLARRTGRCATSPARRLDLSASWPRLKLAHDQPPDETCRQRLSRSLLDSSKTSTPANFVQKPPREDLPRMVHVQASRPEANPRLGVFDASEPDRPGECGCRDSESLPFGSGLDFRASSRWVVVPKSPSVAQSAFTTSQAHTHNGKP